MNDPRFNAGHALIDLIQSGLFVTHDVLLGKSPVAWTKVCRYTFVRVVYCRWAGTAENYDTCLPLGLRPLNFTVVILASLAR